MNLNKKDEEGREEKIVKYPKVIAFHSNILCVRGTSVAMYDYAHYNEKLLCNKSLIIFPRKNITQCDIAGLLNFMKRFYIRTYDGLGELEKILEEEKCDILYCIKYGRNDGIFSRRIKTVIHCVFDMTEPHGDVYAGVSEALARKFGGYCKMVYVPHMIGLRPESVQTSDGILERGREGKEHFPDLRTELGIPESAVVFGRYGGMDTFNIPFCWEAIREILEKRSDIYFLFINTPREIEHKNVMYLQKVVTSFEKNRFIAACDAYLECGTLGHSFGLAIGEFSINNKPIIAYLSDNLWNTSHIEILGDRGIYFGNKEEFYQKLNNFSKSDYIGRDMNCYKQYSPENVMQLFEKVFINN